MLHYRWNLIVFVSLWVSLWASQGFPPRQIPKRYFDGIPKIRKSFSNDWFINCQNPAYNPNEPVRIHASSGSAQAYNYHQPSMDDPIDEINPSEIPKIQFALFYKEFILSLILSFMPMRLSVVSNFDGKKKLKIC